MMTSVIGTVDCRGCGQVQIVPKPLGTSSRYSAVIQALHQAGTEQAVRFAIADYPSLASRNMQAMLRNFFPGLRLRSKRDGPEHRVVWLERRAEKNHEQT